MAASLLRRPLRTLLLGSLLFLASFAEAQVDNVYVYGTVKDYISSRKLDGITVSVFKNGSKLAEVVTNASGKYEFNLDYGSEYKLVYAKPGMVSKNVTIDARGIPEEERAGGHGMNVEMTLFQDIPDVDFAVLQQPIGKSKYDAATNELTWDLQYTEQIRAEITRLMKEYDDKKKREAGADAEYAKLMTQGETAMTAADYKKAVDSFTGALAMKANDAKATARLSDAKLKLEELEGDKKKNEQYAALVKEADNLFGKKDYAAAKTKYEAASEVKEEEAYPKQKIKECQAFIEDLARKAEEEKKAKELEAKYQAAITAGDAAFKAEKYEDARGRYTEASGLKPAEKYPKDQLAAIDKALADLAKKTEEDKKTKELEAKYLAAITAGDAAFKAANYEDARSRYTEASGLKPAEKYPKDQLAAIDKALADLAKKAEEDQKAKEIDAKYQAAIVAADAAFKAANYEVARTKYTEALAVKPAEKYPKDQLTAIDKALADLAKKAEDDKNARELDERYNAVIAAADGAFRSEDLDQAKGKYTEALGIKPAEKYPKDQLAAIEKKLADLAKKAEDDKKTKDLDEKYQAAIAAADKAFGGQQWPDAKTRYTEALGLRPAEKYPKDQLAAIDKALADAARKAAEDKERQELEARFQSLMDEGERLFQAEKYQDARGKYQDALGVRPDAERPKERIVEIDARLAELARKAEEERKRQELDAKYAALITRADGNYDAKKWADALNDYKDALALKPAEQHPKDRIAAIEQLMDSEAKAKAEADRLAREKQDVEQRYADLITRADKAFGTRLYDDAASGYRDALGLKPGEKHPTDRLAEIERIKAELAAKAEADRLKAEQEAAEKARLEEERRKREESLAETEARYRDAIASADIAFDGERFDAAREKYTEALAIKPAENYPKERIAAIEQLLAKRQRDLDDAARLSEEQRRAEEDRKAREAADAEAARLAAEDQRRRLEDDKAVEERYRKVIADADKAMGEKTYPAARDLYTQALDIRPQEAYPQAKIEQIDRLLAEEERRRQEAEAAQANAPKTAPPVRENTTIDIRKEQEAEQFMREARDREEAEKYERIKKLKADVANEEVANTSESSVRREDAVRASKVYEGATEHLYQGSEDMRKRNAAELEAFRNAVYERDQQVRADADAQRTRTGEELEARTTATVEQDGTWRSRHVAQVEAERSAQEAFTQEMADRAQAGDQRGQRAREEVLSANERLLAMQQRGNDQAQRERDRIDREKEQLASRQQQLENRSQDMRMAAKEQLADIPVNQPRSFTDYNRNKLAAEYPQGVTEESYTEGNKVIIRRVVVQGNKADEYSKVIAKWGTFYFKNGQSISEQVWSRDTEE